MVDRNVNYADNLLALYVYDDGFSIEHGLCFFELTRQRLETLAECERAGTFELLCSYPM